ncbi:MAG: hypothetical protein E7138_08555 [Rikenellaceae bacterium]|nr:hypothetical protein [Rikenellaceae bacterium]
MLQNLLQAAEPVMLQPEPGMTLSQTFMAGGWHFMALITLVLACALFAAWKAPAWVKPLGKVAIAIGVLSFLMGVQDMADCCAKVGSEIPFSVYCSGFKVALIAPIYSIIVYVIITIADTVRRPRI